MADRVGPNERDPQNPNFFNEENWVNAAKNENNAWWIDIDRWFIYVEIFFLIMIIFVISLIKYIFIYCLLFTSSPN
jgi:hypothetical protein